MSEIMSFCPSVLGLFHTIQGPPIPWCHEWLSSQWLNSIFLSLFHRHCLYFIHSSADGCLGHFHVLAIMNSATVSTGVWMSLLYANFISFWYISGNKIADNLFSILWGTSMLFSKMAVLLVIPTNSMKVVTFLHIFTGMLSLVFFIISILAGGRYSFIVVCLVL